jgi:hypothetical protein
VFLPLFVIAAVAFGMLELAPARAQTQPQIQTLGSPHIYCYNRRSGRFLHWGYCGPARNRAANRSGARKRTAIEKRANGAACVRRAKQSKLRGKARSRFMRTCTRAS